jgi:hypothetical protein
MPKEFVGAMPVRLKEVDTHFDGVGLCVRITLVF